MPKLAPSRLDRNQRARALARIAAVTNQNFAQELDRAARGDDDPGLAAYDREHVRRAIAKAVPECIIQVQMPAFRARYLVACRPRAPRRARAARSAAVASAGDGGDAPPPSPGDAPQIGGAP